MGLFDFFKKKEEPREEKREDVTNNFICDLCESICQKAEYGDAIENLNEHERVFYITQQLEMEVNNGGFSQFFYNSCGDLSGELVEAFKAIGALKTAEICQKAVSVFDKDILADRKKREDTLDKEEFNDVLCECDDAFLEYNEDLNALNYEYIMKHRDCFEFDN